MLKKTKVGLTCFAVAAFSTVAIGQTATTFIYERIIGSRTNALAPLTLDSATNSIRFRESDAAAANRQWELAVNGEQFRLGALDDAGVLGGTALLVDRTGTVMDSVTLSPTSTIVTGNMRLTTLAGTAANPNLQITSASPNFGLFENDVTGNNGLWIQRPVAEQLRFSACTDGGTCDDWLKVDRTDNVIDFVTLSAAGEVIIDGAATIGDGAGNVITFGAGGVIRNRGTQNNQTTNNSYVSFQQSNGTENGWVGYGSSSSTVHLANSISGGAVNLLTSGGGAIQANGVAIATVNTNWSAADITSGTLPVARGGTGVTTSTGTGSVVLSASPAFTGTPTVGGSAICTADGTNCPGGGGGGGITVCNNVACDISGLAVGEEAIAFKTTATTRVSTTTLTADPVLQFTGAPTNARYLVDADIIWRQGGATNNGISARIGGSNAAENFVCRTMTNTTTANTSETANGTGSANLLAHTASAGGTSDRHMTCTGLSNSFAAPATVQLDWAQETSSATGTVVDVDSWMRVTRIE